MKTKTQASLRLSAAMKKRIVNVAERESRTISQTMEMLLEIGLDEYAATGTLLWHHRAANGQKTNGTTKRTRRVVNARTR